MVEYGRSGNPHDTPAWEWRCGFYAGSRPGECRSGTAASLDEARTEFEAAWKVFLSNRTEADFQEWRDQRDRTARKYRLWDAGKQLEPPSYGPGKPCSHFMKCACGEVFAMYEPAEVVLHVPHISAASRQPSPRRACAN
jgi:hypothetical protein